jgi:hypothetical protein
VRGKNHRPPDPASRPQMCDRNDLLTLGELLEPLLLAIGWAAFGYQLTPDTFRRARIDHADRIESVMDAGAVRDR